MYPCTFPPTVPEEKLGNLRLSDMVGADDLTEVLHSYICNPVIFRNRVPAKEQSGTGKYLMHSRARSDTLLTVKHLFFFSSFSPLVGPPGNWKVPGVPRDVWHHPEGLQEIAPYSPRLLQVGCAHP